VDEGIVKEINIECLIGAKSIWLDQLTRVARWLEFAIDTLRGVDSTIVEIDQACIYLNNAQDLLSGDSLFQHPIEVKENLRLHWPDSLIDLVISYRGKLKLRGSVLRLT